MVVSEKTDSYRRQTRQRYDGTAGALLILGSILSLHQPLIGRLLRHHKFDLRRCRRILDVGSGAGQILGHLLKFAHPDSQIVAVDLSHGMLRRAKARLRSSRPDYVAADIVRLPFDDGTFDAITCGWVLEHLPDPRPGLLELSRILRPGGRMLLLATEDTLPGRVVSQTWNCRTYTREELSSACSEAGLPWVSQLSFTPAHRLFGIGGILAIAEKSA